jgi:hypothetical protein
MALAQKAPFTFSEFEGMQHDWPIFPISEQAQAITVISDFFESSRLENLMEVIDLCH